MVKAIAVCLVISSLVMLGDSWLEKHGWPFGVRTTIFFVLVVYMVIESVVKWACSNPDK